MLDKNNIPQHIAIIMDGNGRWATEKGLPRTAGHREGIKRVKEIVKAAAELGVKIVTFYAFSTENWSRPRKEIDMLMRSLNYFLDHEVKELNKNNIKLQIIGQEDPLPGYLQKKLAEAELKTKNNTAVTMVLALNYGSRQEIVDAVKDIAARLSREELDVKDLDTDKFANFLYTKDLPDPDLLIRTSGEMRISNFLLWQLSYTELYFPKKYWPDFARKDLEIAIKEFQRRERRFGGIHASKTDN